MAFVILPSRNKTLQLAYELKAKEERRLKRIKSMTAPAPVEEPQPKKSAAKKAAKRKAKK